MRMNVHSDRSLRLPCRDCSLQTFIHSRRRAAACPCRLHVAEHQFAKSVSLYTLAISKDATNAVYFGNRSFAHIKVREAQVSIR